jgi:uncharacterized protein (DUF488 family)
MYYRRTILLSLLKAFDGRVEKIRLQKLLFLYCNVQEKPAFYFIPYRYGCFSFQANADLMTLKKYGFVDDGETEWHLKEPPEDIGTLTADDERLLHDIQTRFSLLTTTELIRYTYIKYPFYAINSTILEQNLSAAEIDVVHGSLTKETAPVLFTMGYEGKTLEEFINILLKRNISLLCDVRKNAFSMKYGFSKSTLVNACENAGIAYEHIPALGIESAQRKKLETKEDYRNLFDHYKKTVLVGTHDIQRKLNERIGKNGRAALMCFEADPAMCHRSHLAASLRSLNDNPLPLEHL